jgi:hypothetical protein
VKHPQLLPNHQVLVRKFGFLRAGKNITANLPVVT